MTKPIMDPFVLEGYVACEQEGAEIEDCPHGEGTDGQAGWKMGWKLADKAMSLKLEGAPPL